VPASSPGAAAGDQVTGAEEVGDTGDKDSAWAIRFAEDQLYGYKVESGDGTYSREYSIAAKGLAALGPDFWNGGFWPDQATVESRGGAKIFVN